MSGSPDSPARGALRCPRCGRTFECGMQAGTTRCWCADLPPLDPVPGESCLCPACLRAALDAAPGSARAYRT